MVRSKLIKLPTLQDNLPEVFSSALITQQTTHLRAASRFPTPSRPDAADTTEAYACDDAWDLAEDGAVLASVSNMLYAITNVVTWNMVREATSSDQDLQSLMKVISDGFPTDCRQMSPQLRPYHRMASLTDFSDFRLLGGMSLH